jgi:predicted secreted protein
MATVGAFNATKFRFKLGNANDVFANEKEVKLKFEGDKIPTTTKDSDGWDEFIGGLKRWSGSGTGILAFTPGSGKANFETILTEFLSGDRLTTAKFTTGTTGDKEITGTIFFDSIEVSAVMESAMELSFSFTGSGAPTLATV